METRKFLRTCGNLDIGILKSCSYVSQEDDAPNLFISAYNQNCIRFNDRCQGEFTPYAHRIDTSLHNGSEAGGQLLVNLKNGVNVASQIEVVSQGLRPRIRYWFPIELKICRYT